MTGCCGRLRFLLAETLACQNDPELVLLLIEFQLKKFYPVYLAMKSFVNTKFDSELLYTQKTVIKHNFKIRRIKGHPLLRANLIANKLVDVELAVPL